MLPTPKSFLHEWKDYPLPQHSHSRPPCSLPGNTLQIYSGLEAPTTRINGLITPPPPPPSPLRTVPVTAPSAVWGTGVPRQACSRAPSRRRRAGRALRIPSCSSIPGSKGPWGQTATDRLLWPGQTLVSSLLHSSRWIIYGWGIGLTVRKCSWINCRWIRYL